MTHSGNDQTSHEAIVDAVSGLGAHFLSGLDPSSRAGAKGTVSEPGWIPTGSAVLVVKRGLNAGSRFRLDQQVTSAGRHPDSNIVLDNITVSRRHAEFRLEGRKFRVIDMGSLNGTYVNGQQIDSAVLTNGDEIGMGNFRMVFLTAPDSASDTNRFVPDSPTNLHCAVHDPAPTHHSGLSRSALPVERHDGGHDAHRRPF